MKSVFVRGWGRPLTKWARLAPLGLVLFGAGCYPGDGPANVQDLDVVLTVHDRDVDFDEFVTYAMPDTVLHVSGDEDDDIIDLPRTYDDMILDLVAANMAAAGYDREMDPLTNGADIILLVSAIGTEKTTYWGSGGWWGWWGWYPGWGYPGYPGYGPGYDWVYPPYFGSTTFELGTVVLTLVDPLKADEKDIPVIWSGAGRGLLGSSGAESRITSSINQMFSQSPYLGR